MSTTPVQRNVPKVKTRKTSEMLRKQKEDVVEYCKEMFRNSMLTGVPQIVAAQSTRSKVFKTFVFLGSILGFLYQTSAFLVLYFNYPTLVDVQVTTPPFVDLPSITICNRNGLKRTLYCKMRPEKCRVLVKTEKFCEDHPEVCIKENDFDMYPMPEAYGEEITATQALLQKVGHPSYPLIKSCGFEEVNTSITENFCRVKSYRSFIFQDMYKAMKMCYIINARWSKGTLNLPQVPVRAILTLILDLEPEEYFRLDREVAGQVAVHSPWSILNPFTEGFSVEPKKMYIIQMKETIKNLLPYPYQTNCTDYIEQWRRRGKNGPLSKEMCIEECILNQTVDHCDCVLTSNLYPHNFNFCSENTDFCTKVVNYTHCFVKCSPACHSRHFEIEMTEGNIEVSMTDQVSSAAVKWNKTAMLKILFKRSQVNIYTYRAKYESIEFFSFLGGFVGIWLGISLIALMDFLESVGSFVIFFVGRVKEVTPVINIRSAMSGRNSRNSLYPQDNNAWAQRYPSH